MYNINIYKSHLVVLLVVLFLGMGTLKAQSFSVWDGTIANNANNKFAENGITLQNPGQANSQTNPYTIDNAREFAYFMSIVKNKWTGYTSAYYWKLTADIDLANIEWTYGSNSGNSFQGHFDGGGHTVKNVSLPVTTNSNYGLFPTIQGASATNLAEVKNLKIDSVTISSTADRGATTRLGGLAGYAKQANISNITVSDVTFTYTNTITGNNQLGGVIGYIENNTTITGVNANNITATFSAATTTTNLYFGGLLGASNGSTGITIKGNTVTGVNVTADGNTTNNTYLGGLMSYVKGNGSPNNRALVEGNTVTNATIAMNGEHNAGTLYMGGFLGYCDIHTNVLNNKVVNPALSLTNTINTTTNNAGVYAGGAVGAQAGYTLIDGMTVNGGSITGPTSDKTIINNKTFFVGGFLGMQNSSGTGAYQPNKIKNIAVSGMTINLAHFVPAGTINNHKFAVGGIAGTVNAPNLDATNNWDGMPENIIFKGGKIYAPYAATSPTVANFNASVASYNNYTGENVLTVDAIIRSKTSSWYYSDYELGLSKGLMDNTNAYNAASANGKVKRNFSKATTTDKDDTNLEWLTVSGSTFLKKNRYQDSDRESWTVLWWTRSDNSASYANSDIEQTIYPQSGNTSTTGFADYPYYMYFYQGVANATYASANDADAIIAGITANMTQAAKATPVTLSITNDKENERGFDERTITVAASDGGSYTYQWYLNGKAYTTGSSINLTPHWKDGQGLTVNALSGSTIVATATYTLVPGVMKTKTGSTEKVRSDYTQRGTSSNPYIIDCENALCQLSYLSTMSTSILWEGIIKPGVDPKNQSQGHYNRAYYELGADITMSKEPFVPISHVGRSSSASDGTYAQGFIFQGSFDGKGHKISGLKITWGAGQYNGAVNVYHGLFGAVGNPTATVKWQDASTGSTIIKNLIIDGATLTHDVNNTSFYYNNGISGSANNCMVGVLAGIVGSNTTIQNIEIRNSKITDNGSSDYSLANKGLFVGGAIGSLQNAFNATANCATNTRIDHIAAQVDITLNHPTFTSGTTRSDYLGVFNIGGIIGIYWATSATREQVQNTMPAYTFYSGNITAPKAWISPVLAAVRYVDQQTYGSSGNSMASFSKQWEGNNNTAETQLTITNAQYYKFKINGQPISDFYPANTCGNDARTIVAHTDATEAATTYDARKYQGVNYGARFIDSDGTTLYFMNQEPADDFYWAWDNGFPHMTDQSQTEAYLDRTDNTLTAQMSEGTGSAYRWQVSFDEGKSWADIDGVTLQQYIANPSSKNKLIVAYVTSGVTEYRTQVESIFAGPNPFDIHIAKTGNSGTGYTFNVVWKDDIVPSGSLTTTYQWYHSDKETPFADQTNSSLTLSQNELDAAGGYIWCAVKVQESGTTVYSWMLVAGDLNVVYVNGNGYTGSDSNGAYGAGVDTNDGRSPQTPVKTIDKANSLLDGGLWDKNIIVVMGTLNSDGVFCSTGTNPATLTGKWDGTDYEGVIKIKKKGPDKASGSGQGAEDDLNTANIPGKKGTHCYVMADTKFEHLTFEGNNEDNAFIECHGHDVTFGKGLIMTNFQRLSKGHGNFDGAQVVPELTIILTATNLPEADIANYTNRTKPQVITFQSGHYGRIMGGRYTNAFFAKPENTSHSILGSAEHPIWAVVNIDIDPDNPNKGVVLANSDKKPEVTDGYTCDINAVIAGLTDGSMYGDFTINYHGGNVSYIVGGNQGNPVPNGTLDFVPDGGVLGMSSDKKVAWGQWPNATYFGRTVINVEQDPDLKTISVGSLYSGGLGRQANGNSAKSIVDMYFYGHTEVNVKSGTVDNVYGGGAGGVMGVNPWDAHLPYATTAADNANSAIMNKVQYGDTRYGSWSNMVKGTSPFAKVTLHDLNDAGTGYDSIELDLDSSYTTLNISGGTIIGSVYGGGYGYVADMPYQVALQGIGSVFGTSNINITGGTITGSVYGGSQGDAQFYGKKNNYGQTITHIAEMNGTVNLTITGTDDHYPSIGGNIYGGGKGLASSTSDTNQYLRIATAGNAALGNQDTTDIHVLINLPESHPFAGNIYGGGALGVVDGNTHVVIKGGAIDGEIFGGGKGEAGHPEKAKVTGTTHVRIDANWDELSPDPNAVAPATHNIYGGGEISKVDGNTLVEVCTGTIGDGGLMDGDVFGGGENGDITGSTEVKVLGGTVNGSTYGGGALAHVGANTLVQLLGGTVYDVYGGGLGRLADNEHGITAVEAHVVGNGTVVLDGSIVRNSIFGSNNLNGTVQGHVFVDVKNTTPRAGQGAGEYDVPAVYGGGNQADYVPTSSDDYAEVLVENCTNSIAYVYGGGNAAAVPKAAVTIQGGAFDYVFAGGNGAGEGNPGADVGYRNHTDVDYGLGTAEVNVHGGVIEHLFAGSNERGRIREDQSVNVDDASGCEENVREVYGGGNLAAGRAGTITVGCGSYIGDVYGGANQADISSDIVVNITGGSIDRVFGGNNTSGNISGAITVNVNKSDDCDLSLGYVYGAGNQAAYTPTSPGAYPAVNILKGTVTHDVFGGGLGASAVVTSNPAVTISGGAVSGNVYGGGSAASVVGSTAVSMTSGSANNIYGGGLGNATNVSGNVAVTVSGGTVTEDVYGGSGFGTVNTDTENTTTVTINNGAHVGRDVFGGGFGQKADNGADPAIPAYEADVNGNVSVTIRKGAQVGGNVYGGNNTNGSPKGAITVLVDGPMTDSEPALSLSNVFGGGKNAATTSLTAPEVTIQGCETVVGRVFGGGDAASATATNVTVWGGHITNAFGGGNGEVTAADVAGDVLLTIKGGDIDNVFGGSNTAGNIAGTVNVVINKDPAACDMTLTNVYGGGNLARGKAGTLTIACTGDGTIDTVYGGANNADVDGDIVLNINGGNIGNVFGGNNNGGVINGNITVNVDWDGTCGSNSLTNVYGGGNKAAYGSNKTPRNPEVNIFNATIEGDVFGGGLGASATVTGNPQVNVNTNTDNEHTYNHKVVVNGSVYGGGSAAPVVGNPTVTTRGMDGDDKKVLIRNHVFGGGLGSSARTDGTTTVHIYGNTEVEKNVYGGGNGGEVTGDTHVVIGESCE